jgi:cytoskeletal protein CcmA (bactofilin family)
VLKKFIPQKSPAAAETISPASTSDHERPMPSYRDENPAPAQPSLTLTEHQKHMAEHSGKDVLSSDVEIKGSIKFQKELLIDGKVEGEINSDGVLTIGENADIRGEIKTKSITVFGKVHGNITVGERCELKSRCVLQGDLKAARLVIEEGATFIGKSEVTSGKAPANSNGSPTRAEVPRAESRSEDASPAAKSLASRA